MIRTRSWFLPIAGLLTATTWLALWLAMLVIAVSSTPIIPALSGELTARW